MTFSTTELQRLKQEHQTYLDRIIPTIKQRLRARGISPEQIAQHIEELPREHFAVAIARLISARHSRD